MFRIQDIKGNGDHLIAYKIVEKKYIDNIVNLGQIYFGLLEDYRKMETQKKHEIGDSFEAAQTIKISSYININGEYEQLHGSIAGNNIRINANQCAFCFYMVGLKSFENKGDDEYSYFIPWQELDMICRDKGGIENCAIIIFSIDTIHKIYAELKKRGFNYAGSKVKYDDYDCAHLLPPFLYAILVQQTGGICHRSANFLTDVSSFPGSSLLLPDQSD